MNINSSFVYKNGEIKLILKHPKDTYKLSKIVLSANKTIYKDQPLSLNIACFIFKEIHAEIRLNSKIKEKNSEKQDKQDRKRQDKQDNVRY